MSWWDNVKDAFGGKQRPGTGLEVSRWVSAPPRRGTSELLRAYKEMPWLRTVVDVVADNVANAQWRVYCRVSTDGRRDFTLRTASKAARAARIRALTQSGEMVEVPDHPLLSLLTDPSDHLSGRAVLKLSQVHLDLVGEAFWVLDRVAGVIVGAWPVPPNAVIALPDLSAPREERVYQVNIGGKARRIPAADVVALRTLDPDDPLGRGIGPAFALGDELDADEYAARYTKNYFFNSTLPAAVVSIDGLNDANAAPVRAFKESLEREHKGPDRAGKLLVTGGKTTFARLDTSLKDMQFVELRRFLMEFVRMTYRVPPEIVGDISNSNRATAFAARELLAEQAVLPRLEFLRTELQARLAPQFGPDVVLDYDSPVPADREHQLKVMSRMPEAFSYDEWRELAGLRPDADRQGYPLPMPGQVETQPAGETPAQEPEAASGEPWQREPQPKRAPI
jgi:HK97 family phage portal protein